MTYNYKHSGLEDVAREADLDALALRETMLPVP